HYENRRALPYGVMGSMVLLKSTDLYGGERRLSSEVLVDYLTGGSYVKGPAAAALRLPPHGWVKMNVNAAHANNGIVGLAFGVCDSQGDVYAFRGWPESMHCGSAMVKALALRFWVQIARHLGLFPLCLETDA
ncbi:hypothetical protein Ancab_016486, partial [Ancistrocladus abbreviatus]